MTPKNPTQKLVDAVLKNRSVEWAADKLGVSVRSVENWRDGKCEPRAKEARALAALAAKESR